MDPLKFGKFQQSDAYHLEVIIFGIKVDWAPHIYKIKSPGCQNNNRLRSQSRAAGCFWPTVSIASMGKARLSKALPFNHIKLGCLC
jgi:hypothetical protein